VAKPEWGTKRQCPKCGERFYDLNKPFPLTCVACGVQFEPEVILKSKQTGVVEDLRPRKAPVTAKPEEDLDEDLLDEDIELEEEEGDDDILADVDLDDDDDVTDVIEKPRSPGDEV